MPGSGNPVFVAPMRKSCGLSFSTKSSSSSRFFNHAVSSWEYNLALSQSARQQEWSVSTRALISVDASALRLFLANCIFYKNRSQKQNKIKVVCLHQTKERRLVWKRGEFQNYNAQVRGGGCFGQLPCQGKLALCYLILPRQEKERCQKLQPNNSLRWSEI